MQLNGLSSSDRICSKRNISRKADAMASNLLELRKAAGYKNASDFAEAHEIPASTYARYERAGDGADCGIPLPAAWQIADKLGCSIDLVIGREDIDASCSKNTINERIESLSYSSLELLESFLQFLEYRDSRASSDKQR